MWYLIPDKIAEMRLPPSIFTLSRYGDPVGILEYLCNIWVGQHSTNCFDDYNIVVPPKFGHVFDKFKGRTPVQNENPVHSGPNVEALRYNVIAMQFDSLSRYQAISEMPLLQTFFEDRLFKKSKKGLKKNPETNK